MNQSINKINYLNISKLSNENSINNSLNIQDKITFFENSNDKSTSTIKKLKLLKQSSSVPLLIKTKTKNFLPKIINEIPKKLNIFSFPITTIIFIYKKDFNTLIVRTSIKIIRIKTLISEKLNLKMEKFNLIYNNNVISIEDYNKRLNEIINFNSLKKKPVFIIKKILNISEKNDLFLSDLPYKIKIENYPEIANVKTTFKDELNFIVKDFFKKLKINEIYLCEKIAKNTYLVSFNSSNLAFDFSRYMHVIKNRNLLFKNIIIKILLNNIKKNVGINKNNSSSKINNNNNYFDFENDYNYIKNLQNKNIIFNRNNNKVKFNLSYIFRKKELNKNIHDYDKNKWITPKGFISTVNGYNGILI